MNSKLLIIVLPDDVKGNMVEENGHQEAPVLHGLLGKLLNSSFLVAFYIPYVTECALCSFDPCLLHF